MWMGLITDSAYTFRDGGTRGDEPPLFVHRRPICIFESQGAAVGDHAESIIDRQEFRDEELQLWN